MASVISRIGYRGRLYRAAFTAALCITSFYGNGTVETAWWQEIRKRHLDREVLIVEVYSPRISYMMNSSFRECLAATNKIYRQTTSLFTVLVFKSPILFYHLASPGDEI